MLSVELKRKNKKLKVSLELKSRIYVDTILEMEPIHMFSCDILSVTYDIAISGYVDGILTSTIKENYTYTFRLKKSMVVSYVRFTKLKKKANIEIYEKLPSDFHIPKKFNATLVKEKEKK